MPRLDFAIARRRTAAITLRGLLLAALAAGLAGCKTGAGDITGSVDSDYRKRHPISIGESNRSLAVFVGSGRGGLTPTQRAEVLAFAQNWKREATGGVTIERPAGGPNHGIGIRPYQAGTDKVAPLRLNYPLVQATAGPCGLWPDDVGPSYDPKHFQNRQYHNFGCANQRNLAAMVANPSDLVQPRAETPVYTAKRTFGMDKWRRGESPATVYPDAQRGAVSDIGR